MSLQPVCLWKISVYLPAKDKDNHINTQLDSLLVAVRRQMSLDMKLCEECVEKWGH